MNEANKKGILAITCYKPEPAIQRSNILVNQAFKKCPEYCQHHSGHQKVIQLHIHIFKRHGSGVYLQEETHQKHYGNPTYDILGRNPAKVGRVICIGKCPITGDWRFCYPTSESNSTQATNLQAQIITYKHK